MLDCNVMDPETENGAVSLLVPENEYDGIEVPQAINCQVVSPRSVLLGVADEVLENTLFTRVKLNFSDFDRHPGRSISLLFVKKDVVEKMPAAIAGFSPVFLILEDYYDSRGYFIGQNAASKSKISMLLKDHSLLLPLYLTSRRWLAPQGVNVALRYCNGSAVGKLWARAFICKDIILFGKSYYSLPDCRCTHSKGHTLNFLWREWRVFEDICNRLISETVNYDIAQMAIPDYLKYSGEVL